MVVGRSKTHKSFVVVVVVVFKECFFFNLTIRHKMQIFKECPLCQTMNIAETNNERNPRTYVSADCEGFYQLESRSLGEKSSGTYRF